MFDLILKTQETEHVSGGSSRYEIINHPMVITKFAENFSLEGNNSGQISKTGTYEIFEKEKGDNTFYLPSIWGLNTISENDLGNTPFNDMLSNWLTIRGVSTPPVHPVAQVLSHNAPVSNYSLQDLVTQEESSINLGPIQLNYAMGYKSLKKYGTTNIFTSDDGSHDGSNVENVIGMLLKSFVGNDSNLQEIFKDYQNVLLENLLKTEKLNGISSNEKTIKTLLRTKKLFKQQVDAIIEEYPSAYTKYNNIITYIIDNSVIPGVDDHQIINQWSEFTPERINQFIEQVPRFSGLCQTHKLFKII